MLDINPIKKENNQVSGNDKAESQSEQRFQGVQNSGVSSDSQQKPLKTLNADYLKNSSNTSEPEFLETEDVSRLVFYFALVSMFLILGMTGYLYFAKKTQTEELKTKERIQADLEAKIATPDLATIDNLASRYSLGLDQLNKLINNPIEYSLLFKELEKIVPNDVILNSINIDEKNTYKITAKTNELESSAKFVKSLEKSSFFDTVFLSSNQLSSDKDNKYYTVSIDGLLDNKKMIASTKDTTSESSLDNEDLDSIPDNNEEVQ